MEAFKLSDQCSILLEKGILAPDVLAQDATDHQDRNKKKKDSSGNSGEKIKSVGDSIQLNSNVLVRNEETNIIDSFLLSVPLPITALTAFGENKKANTMSRIKGKIMFDSI